MFRLGPLELTIILAIVILLFGIGRIGKIGGELGAGIKAFREGLSSKDDEEDQEADSKTEQKS